MVYCRKDCCYVYFHVLSSASLWRCRQNRRFLPASWAPPLIGWLHFEWHAARPITGLILAHSLVNTAESCHVCSYRRPQGCDWSANRSHISGVMRYNTGIKGVITYIYEVITFIVKVITFTLKVITPGMRWCIMSTCFTPRLPTEFNAANAIHWQKLNKQSTTTTTPTKKASLR